MKYLLKGRTLLLMFFICSLVASLSAQFAGGTGTEGDPFLVQTADHLNNVRDYSSSYFRQTADIDLDVDPYNTGSGWVPIASFTGNYDGNDYIIANLFIDRPGESNVGLINSANGAVLNNIALVDVDVTGGSNTGSLVGQLIGASAVIHCSAAGGTLTGGGNTGGLVGLGRYDSTIDNSYTDLTVAGDFPAGGLIGQAGHFDDSCDISRSFVLGHTTATTLTNSFVGGVVGNLWGSILSESYNAGPVTGHYAGGLAARCYNGTIIDSYAVGFISGPTDDYLAGLIAQAIGTTPVINTYWNIETTGQTTSAGDLGEGLITTQMIQQATYTDWDFTEAWEIVESESYPFHIWQGGVQDYNYPPPLPPANLTAQIQAGVESITLMWDPPAIGNPLSYNIYRDSGEDFSYLDNVINDTFYEDDDITFMTTYKYYLTAVYPEGESMPSNTVTSSAYSGYAGGSGTEGDPYLVATAEHLFNVRYEKDKHYLQIANIDFDLEPGPWDSAEGFEPIGEGYYIEEHSFTGSYDGNDYTINNLTMSQARSTVGLFGYAIGAIFRNIGLVNVDISGGMDTGALAGYALSNTIVFNCYSTGTVTAGSYGGGLIGRFEGGSSMTNCYSTADVSAGYYVGGLVGALNNAGVSISNSYATGNITATSAWFGGEAGGLVGATGGGAIISNTFATGDVSGTEYVGGLLGKHTQGSTVSNSYAIGNVSGDYDTGGLVGYLENNPGPVSFSYWNTETSGQTTSQGGAGRTTSEMTYPYATNTYEGWDFNIIWEEDVDGDINNGYPYFIWMTGEPIIPEIPTVSLEIIGDDASINWNLIPDCDGYVVYGSDYPDAITWDLVTTISDYSVTNYTEATIARRYYRVASYIGELESELSEVVGYSRYECVAGLNMVALPMETDFAMASDLGDYYTGMIDQISYWDQNAQQFVTAVYLLGSWEGDFPIATNSVLMINATSPFNLYSAGYLSEVDPIYPIVAGLNTIMVPTDREDLTMASSVADDFGDSIVDQISYWDSNNQQFVTAALILGSWEGDFPVTITQPLIVNSDQAMSWPGTSRGAIPSLQPRNRNFNIRY